MTQELFLKTCLASSSDYLYIKRNVKKVCSARYLSKNTVFTRKCYPSSIVSVEFPTASPPNYECLSCSPPTNAMYSLPQPLRSDYTVNNVVYKSQSFWLCWDLAWGTPDKYVKLLRHNLPCCTVQHFSLRCLLHICLTPTVCETRSFSTSARQETFQSFCTTRHGIPPITSSVSGQFIWILWCGLLKNVETKFLHSRLGEIRNSWTGSKYIPLSYFVTKVTNFVFYKEGNFFASWVPVLADQKYSWSCTTTGRFFTRKP
jgi:hypothetical protein